MADLAGAQFLRFGRKAEARIDLVRPRTAPWAELTES